MNEELLQHIWQHKYLIGKKLKTTCNKQLYIVKPGLLNTNAGPDFFNALIKIEDTLWAGNVEIHIQASSWNLHRHQNDEAYNNIILHVVYNYDKDVYDFNNNRVITLELKDYIPISVLKKYKFLLEHKTKIACSNIFIKPKEIDLQQWLNRLSAERLEHKSNYIFELLNRNKENWNETFYQLLCKYFGQKVNEEPFLLLARTVPLNILAKHKNNLLQIQALLLGAAGFLKSKPINNYSYSLYNEYEFLENKYAIDTMNAMVWKFAKTRPANFPTVRILQLAELTHKSVHLFSKINESKDITYLYELLSVKTPQLFSMAQLVPKSSNTKTVSINSGKQFVNSLIINVAIPAMFSYGKYKNNQTLADQALILLSQCNKEDNFITKAFSQLGISASDAMEAQALIQLYNNYCLQLKCLNCTFGNNLLFKTNE